MSETIHFQNLDELETLLFGYGTFCQLALNRKHINHKTGKMKIKAAIWRRYNLKRHLHQFLH